ncbi:ATP-binding protein [Sphingomonas sp. NBWT7]|uniref:PAS domain-containing sensor histidine kinase n=1 Tax=Sphingomonas sp. NBWT7 TaxID=2596913 RepID=UPI0016283833|nr:ATP-binding protein [Sphingomonas sp. NBWT7]
MTSFAERPQPFYAAPAPEQQLSTSVPSGLSSGSVENYADGSPLLLLHADPSGEALFLNLRYSDLTGEDRDQAIAEQLWKTRIHPEDLGSLLGTLKGADEDGRLAQAEFRLKHADASFRWMRLYLRLHADDDGNLVWHGMATDIEGERAAQLELQALSESLQSRINRQAAELARTEARYSSLFAVSKIAFAEQDMAEAARLLQALKAEGVTDLAAYMDAHPETMAKCVAAVTTVSVNEACMSMLGFDDVDGAVDRPVDRTAEDIETVLLRQFEMIFYDRESVEGRVVLIGSKGRRVPVFYSATRLGDERQLSSLVDVSSQERVEELRRAAQEELARANRVATVGAFSASIAHELNQPIASVSMDANTGLRLLRRDTPDFVSAIRILERVATTAQRIGTIVKHTHDQITSGRQDLRRLDPAQLARRTCELLARDMRDDGVDLRFEDDGAAPAIMGDFIDLQQVLINLVNNARDSMLDVPHVPKIITVRVQSTEHQVAVCVEDVGKGIPEDDKDRLFQPFFTTKAGGIGLGLQICLSTIQRMGGEMTAANRPAGGAVFCFRLPALD